MIRLLVGSLSMTTVMTASLTIASVAMAQEPATSRSADIPTAIDEIFFGNSGPYSRNRTTWRYGTTFFLGLGGFAEHDILKDVNAINAATVFLLNEQATSDPTIRVPDLANPYNTSVQFLPAAQQTNSRLSGSEFIFEIVPIP